MAGGVIAPVLPELVQQLKLNPAIAGNLVSAHCLTIALFSPPLGILADRKGRLPVLVVSLVLFAVFGMVGGIVQDLPQLLLARGLMGAACGGIAAASLGLLTSLYEGDARAKVLGYATSTLTFTGILYPVLGGIIGNTHWRYAFWSYGIALPLALLCLWVFQRTAPPSGQADSARPKPSPEHQPSLPMVLKQRSVIGLLLLLAIASVVMYSVVIYAPLYLKQPPISATPKLNGLVLGIRAIGAAIISAWGSRWLMKNWGYRGALALGFGIMAATLVAIPLTQNVGLILLSALLFGLGFGLVLPNLYGKLADFAPPHLRSSVLAAGTGAGFLGQFSSPIVLAPIVQIGGGLPSAFYGAALISLICGAILLISPLTTQGRGKNA